MGSHAAHNLSRKVSAAGKVVGQGAKQTGESAVSRFQNRQAAVNQGREFAYGKAAELGMSQAYLDAHRVKDDNGNNIGFDKEGNKYILISVLNYLIISTFTHYKPKNRILYNQNTMVK